MSVKFKTVQKGNPQSSAIPSKYYAQAVADGELTFEELTTIVASKSKLPFVDCYRVLLHLEETMRNELQHGKVVRLGNIGSFQLGITSNGYAIEKQVTAATINNAKVNFRPGKGFKEMLKELEYKKVK
jgi:predicted histone-like DNA-binding protein